MRIQRISLRNYRGIKEADVTLAQNGVTIIQGPNEVGKSSLAEAIQFLFEEPDSSTKTKLKAVKPVNVDTGASAEVELTTGPYRVVYFKQWNPGARTNLQILEPTPENLTGRPAHDRMKTILAETLDEALWRALHYHQGASIAQVDLGESRTLASALDAAAAAGSLGGEEETDLWKQVGEERMRYFTGTGRPTVDRTRLDEEVARLRGRVSELQAELAALDAAAERYRQIGIELTANSDQKIEQAALVEQHTALWDQVSAKQRELERLELEAQATDALAREAVSAGEERQRLVDAVATAGNALAELEKQAERGAPGLETARAAQADALRERDLARGARETADETSRRASADFEHFRELLDRQLLVERQERVKEAELKSSQAAAFLEQCLIDDAKLEEIEQASLAAAEARARLTGQNPIIRVVALQQLEVRSGDELSDLSAGESFETPVAGDVELTLGNVARVTVTGGAGGRAFQEASSAAEERLAGLYRSVEITGGNLLAQARDLVRRRRETEAEAEQANKALNENLRDLTPQLLTGKIERAEASIASYRSGRDSLTPLPADLDEAKPISERAAAAADEARRLESECQVKVEQAEATLAGVQDEANRRTARLELAQQTVVAAEQQLEVVRAQITDAEIDEQRRRKEQDAADARAAHAQKASELASDDPASALALLENARAVLERLRSDEQTLKQDLSGIKSELGVRGEAGLHDELAAAESQLAGREREKTLTDRRAAAVDLLYTRLAANRDAAKRSYVAPFKQQLDAYARIVFGTNVSVEVDHETLQIVSRTLDGVTIPYDSLSAGAREQLCVLARLACAALVSPADDGETNTGVPVIFDDALGYSDPSRLERVGAAFKMASNQSQVIVLTCVPERYRNIGSATVIHLEENALNPSPA